MSHAMAVDASGNVFVTGYFEHDHVFERGRAAVDQPLQRTGERL